MLLDVFCADVFRLVEYAQPGLQFVSSNYLIKFQLPGLALVLLPEQLKKPFLGGVLLSLLSENIELETHVKIT